MKFFLSLFLSTALLLTGLPVRAETASPPAPGEKPQATEGPAIDVTTGPYTHIGQLLAYESKYEDTFIDLARANNLGFVEMRAANPGIDPWMPGAGQEIILPTMHLLPDAPQEGIVINLPGMRLYYYPEDGSPPQSWPIGIGREGLLTPTGTTHVRAKTPDPSWRPTERMREENPSLPKVVPPGPENPLGTHMIYLGWPEYGIHGTNKPYGIGRRVSSGCIRMYPEGILDLYPKAEKGAMVTVVDQPIKTAWIGRWLFIEAHPTMKQADAMETDGSLPSYEVSTREMETIMAAAGPWYDAVDWQKVRQVVRERRGYPVAVAEKPLITVAEHQ